VNLGKEMMGYKPEETRSRHQSRESDAASDSGVGTIGEFPCTILTDLVPIHLPAQQCAGGFDGSLL